jgi:hypothetical protein
MTAKGKSIGGSHADDESKTSPVDLIVWRPKGFVGPALYLTNTAMSIPGRPQAGGFYGARSSLLYGAFHHLPCKVCWFLFIVFMSLQQL